MTDPQNNLSEFNNSFSGSSRSVWEYSSDGDKEELCSREDSLQKSSNAKFGTYRVFLSPTYDTKNKVKRLGLIAIRHEYLIVKILTTSQ